MSDLAKQSCIPCRGDEPPLTKEEIEERLQQVDGWELLERDSGPRIRKRFSFKDFRGALDFTMKVGEEAEKADHHPRIVTQWGKVTVDWWTHAISGLHNNDFIMAARSDRLYAES